MQEMALVMVYGLSEDNPNCSPTQNQTYFITLFDSFLSVQEDVTNVNLGVKVHPSLHTG